MRLYVLDFADMATSLCLHCWFELQAGLVVVVRLRAMEHRSAMVDDLRNGGLKDARSRLTWAE